MGVGEVRRRGRVSGTCNLVYVSAGAAESGRGHRRAGWGQAEKTKRDSEREKKHESGDGLPTQDDLQLAAVELPAVGQTHDALLVARQVLHVHLLHEETGKSFKTMPDMFVRKCCPLRGRSSSEIFNVCPQLFSSL